MAARLAEIRRKLYSGERYIQEDGQQVDLDSSMNGSTKREDRKREFLNFLIYRALMEFSYP
jgi:hypothetical protein